MVEIKELKKLKKRKKRNPSKTKERYNDYYDPESQPEEDPALLPAGKRVKKRKKGPSPKKFLKDSLSRNKR